MSVMSHSLISLPDPALEAILSYLTYDEIAKYRIVCKRFDDVCGHLLNRGFYTARSFLNKAEEKVKKKMPRKITDRNNSIYVNHQIMLWQIDLDLRRLHAVYSEYLETGRCYFIPGKLLDKIYAALIYLGKCNTNPRVNLTELENLTVMATEHFQEHILPVIRYRKTERYLTFDQLDDPFDQFSLDVNTSALFSADELPKFGFSADEPRATTSSGGNDYPPGEYATSDSTDKCTAVKNNMTESQAGKCAVSKSNTADFPTPGCSWMKDPTPEHNYSDVQVIVNDIQYMKSTLGQQFQQIGEQNSKLKKQAFMVNEQKTKLYQMEATLAENDHKYALLKKKLEILCNNYTRFSHTSDTSNTTSYASVPGSINLMEGNCSKETSSSNIEMHRQQERMSAEVHMQGRDRFTLLKKKKNEKLKEETGGKAGPSQKIHAKSACPSQKGIKKMKTQEVSDESDSE